MLSSFCCHRHWSTEALALGDGIVVVALSRFSVFIGSQVELNKLCYIFTQGIYRIIRISKVVRVSNSFFVRSRSLFCVLSLADLPIRGVYLLSTDIPKPRKENKSHLNSISHFSSYILLNKWLWLNSNDVFKSTLCLQKSSISLTYWNSGWKQTHVFKTKCRVQINDFFSKYF